MASVNRRSDSCSPEMEPIWAQYDGPEKYLSCSPSFVQVLILIAWNLSWAVEDYATLFFYATRCLVFVLWNSEECSLAVFFPKNLWHRCQV